MKAKLAVLAALLATCAWAQEKTVKVITVKPANVERIQRTLKMVVGDDSVVCDTTSSTLVVRAIPTLMPAVEQVAKELDAATPAVRNIDLTFYIVEATKEPAAEPAAFPAELQPVIAQLKGVLGYQGFRLFDTAFIRTRSGERAEASGQAQVPNGTAGYHLNLQAFASSETTPATIRIDNSRFQAWVGSTNAGFSVNVDLKEGQQAVIGRAGVEGNRSALILVASGKIVE
jgi:hypothetical protein